MRAGTRAAKLLGNSVDRSVEARVRVFPREHLRQQFANSLIVHRMLQSRLWDPGSGAIVLALGARATRPDTSTVPAPPPAVYSRRATTFCPLPARRARAALRRYTRAMEKPGRPTGKSAERTAADT